MSETHRVLVLRKEQSGESFLKLHVLGSELGTQLCLKRVSSKSRSQKTAPDLFDTAEIQVETSKQGTALFVGEYQLIQRRSEIGQSYRSLQYASNFSNLLIMNGTHMADLPILYQLAERSLNAFSADLNPAVTFLKSLYILLKDEGYPVRESWWPQVPRELRKDTRRLLAEPIPKEIAAPIQKTCEASIEHLLQWLNRETDLTLPNQIL